MNSTTVCMRADRVQIEVVNWKLILQVTFF